MDYTKSEAYEYLRWMETYFFGDFSLFQMLSIEAEASESTSSSVTDHTILVPPPPSNLGSMFPGTSPQPIFRATIPFTLAMFACMDVVGYLVRRISGRNRRPPHEHTTQNIKEFYSHVTDGPTEDELDCLIKMYRHGIAHNYFPKLGMAISYHSKNQNKLFFKNSNNIPVLNVNILAGYFLTGFSSIKNNPALAQTIIDNYNKMKTHYQVHDRCNMTL